MLILSKSADFSLFDERRLDVCDFDVSDVFRRGADAVVCKAGDANDDVVDDAESFRE